MYPEYTSCAFPISIIAITQDISNNIENFINKISLTYVKRFSENTNRIISWTWAKKHLNCFWPGIALFQTTNTVFPTSACAVTVSGECHDAKFESESECNDLGSE